MVILMASSCPRLLRKQDGEWRWKNYVINTEHAGLESLGWGVEKNGDDIMIMRT